MKLTLQILFQVNINAAGIGMKAKSNLVPLAQSIRSCTRVNGWRMTGIIFASKMPTSRLRLTHASRIELIWRSE